MTMRDFKVVTSNGDVYVSADVFERMVERGDVVEVKDQAGGTFFWSVDTEAVQQAVQEVRREMETEADDVV